VFEINGRQRQIQNYRFRTTKKPFWLTQAFHFISIKAMNVKEENYTDLTLYSRLPNKGKQQW
jgi:hypothetical protein